MSGHRLTIGSIDIHGHSVRIYATESPEQPDPQALQLDVELDRSDLETAIAALRREGTERQ